MAHELHKDLQSLVKSHAKNEVRLGEYLYNLKLNGLYKKAVGEGINTWVDYLKQPEVNITQHRANKLCKIYKHFCLDLEIEPEDIEGIPVYALSHISEKGLTDKDAVYKMLEHAMVLSEKDFKEQYHDEVGAEERTYTYLVMKKCDQTGTMQKVHGINTQSLLEFLMEQSNEKGN